MKRSKIVGIGDLWSVKCQSELYNVSLNSGTYLVQMIESVSMRSCHLSRDVLDYVKTGMASIIEDEVTSRFVAEELKSWNLMMRANSQFEFINWRLTTFWLLGGVFRYFILLPARLLILVIGVMSSVLILCPAS